MTDESLSSEELAIGRLIGRLADVGTRHRDPTAVVQGVVGGAERRRFGWPVLAFGASIAVVLVLAPVVLGPFSQSSSPATAGVRGLTYDVAVARSIDLSGARLTPFAEATQNSGFATAGATAYAVDNLDPRQVLVMELRPGEKDDAGSIGSHLVLVRGEGFSLVCPYFPAGDPLAPSVCP